MLYGGGVTQRHDPFGHLKTLLGRSAGYLTSFSIERGRLMCENNRDVGRGLLYRMRDDDVRRRESVRVSGRHVETLYFGMIIAIILVVFSSQGWWIALNRLWIILLVPVVYGMVAYIKMVSLDVEDSRFARNLEIIHDALISLDSDNFRPVIAKALAAVTARDKTFDDWSSPKGIVQRGKILQGTKTIIALLNCCFLTASLGVLIWPNSPVFACIVGLLVLLLGVSLHVLYAALRYWKGRFGPVQYKASSLL